MQRINLGGLPFGGGGRESQRSCLTSRAFSFTDTPHGLSLPCPDPYRGTAWEGVANIGNANPIVRDFFHFLCQYRVRRARPGVLPI